MLVGGPGDEAADTNRCRQQRVRMEAENDGVVALTQMSKAELSKELGFQRARSKRWAWTWQRCGRYEYRKCLTHLTNPDHYVGNAPRPADVLHLRIATRYAAGRPRATDSE